MKYAWLTKHHTKINISLACNLLCISRTQYYSWLSNGDKRNLKQQELDMLISQIKAEYELSEKTYGSCKITKRLQANNIKVGHNKVATIMQSEDIKSRVCHKYKVCTTDSNHRLPIYENKLNRGFTAPRPNHSWCGDITFCSTGDGWLYLATVIDLYSNKVIGYAMSNKIDKWLVVKALSNALHARGYPSGVIMHTDRGSVYCSKLYRNLIKANNLIGSMSRKGNCWGATRSRLIELSYSFKEIRPPMLLGEPTVVNKEPTGQCNEALCARFNTRVANSSGSHARINTRQLVW